MSSPTSLPVRVVSSRRVFPASHSGIAAASPAPSVVPLSLLDNKCDMFGHTTAVWLFDAHPDWNLQEDGDGEQSASKALLRSLESALSQFPWWCGAVSRCPPGASPNSATAHTGGGLPAHCTRFGRLLLTYGADSDPGVVALVAQCSLKLKDVVPSSAELAARGSWHCQALLSADLCKQGPLLGEGEKEHRSARLSSPPCMLVQLTAFGCGGVAVGVRILHALADAASLTTFMHHWAEVHHAALSGQALTSRVQPLLDAQMLDRAAAGDIDAAQPDAALLHLAHSLPVQRWDRWSSAAGCHPSLADQHVVPSGIDPAQVAPPGAVIAWSNWDPTVPCDYYALHFAADELRRMRLAATTPHFRPSTLQALGAHLWRAICVARGLEGDRGEAHFVNNIGLRSRLPSPIPSTCLGSPVLEVTTTLPVSTVLSGPMADVASAIQQTLSSVNATTVPALLHSFAYEDHPARWCHGMFGLRHVAFTSWQHCDVQDVQFPVPGHTPRYIDVSFLNSTDGFATIMEAGGSATGDLLVQLRLQSAAMSRLMADPGLLRQFRTPPTPLPA